MGCESSKEDTRRQSISGRRNTLVVKPKASIKAGEGINIQDVNGTILIFIFGNFVFFY